MAALIPRRRRDPLKNTPDPPNDWRRLVMRMVKVSELAMGQTVAADVSNVHQQVILPAGTILDDHRRGILKAWGIQEVAVKDSAASESSLPVVPERADAEDGILALGDDVTRPHPVLRELAFAVTRVGPGLGPLIDAVPPLPAQKAAGARARPGPLSVEALVANARVLPSLPSVYFQVDRVINHPSSSVADIGAVLAHDQALCARLLRIANSAFYGFPQRIEGVAEAVRIMGTRQLRDLVLATVVLMQFKGLDPRLVNMTSFWRHALASGIAARAIAGLRRESNTERFFVAGLLHDIGSLLLYQAQPALAQAAIERHRATDLSLEAAERAVIGCHHGAVGAALMASWKLPHFYQDVAAGHHAVDARLFTPESAVIWLADFVAMALRVGSNGEAKPAKFNPGIWALVGIGAGALPKVVDDLVKLLGEIQRMFFGEENGS